MCIHPQGLRSAQSRSDEKVMPESILLGVAGTGLLWQRYQVRRVQQRGGFLTAVVFHNGPSGGR